eukprot:CAMPEP_0179007338 /NCGR_PEP_ID=MMETSP0795-20121207/15107_1 /TAXON_ID=88552 /ORGANISM="Amoebophrya sp., Strain Ameob2" /LENGTH=124 /DNA_ID=CAMNT_0020702305 /DNA_START=195 /DNA_END=569 /DNA_ORIENTATION=+
MGSCCCGGPPDEGDIENGQGEAPNPEKEKVQELMGGQGKYGAAQNQKGGAPGVLGKKGKGGPGSLGRDQAMEYMGSGVGHWGNENTQGMAFQREEAHKDAGGGSYQVIEDVQGLQHNSHSVTRF